MIATLRAAITKIVLPWRWKHDPQHAACALKRFGEVEADSAWQYMNAIQYTEDPRLKVMLFDNLLEEMAHADAFVKISHQLARQRLSGPTRSRVAMIKKVDDMPYFLAFAHESERAISAQFNSYAEASKGLPDASQIFTKIAVDELDHEREARASLIALIGSERRVRRLLWRVRYEKVLTAWLRGSRRIGDAISTIWFGLIYLLFGPFLLRSCRREIGMEDDHGRHNVASSSDQKQVAIEAPALRK